MMADSIGDCRTCAIISSNCWTCREAVFHLFHPDGAYLTDGAHQTVETVWGLSDALRVLVAHRSHAALNRSQVRRHRRGPQ